MLSRSHLAMRRWDDAEAAARRVLTIDPHNPQASCMLARIRIYQKQPPAAVDAALDAIGTQYGNPMGHFLLGAALAQMEQWEPAATALRNCLQLNPRFFRAQRLLARVHRAMGDRDIAAGMESQLLLARHVFQQENRSRMEEVTRAAADRKALRDAVDHERRETSERLKAEYDAIEALDFILVSGLPRSGTSLMMQILEAAGIPVMTDGKRQADEDNPVSYCEWEEIKTLPKNPRLLEKAGPSHQGCHCSAPSPAMQTPLQDPLHGSPSGANYRLPVDDASATRQTSAFRKSPPHRNPGPIQPESP